MDIESLLVHGDRAVGDEAAVAPVLFPSSTYRARDARHFAELATADRPQRFYARYGNPTLAQTETLLAQLENAEQALLFASGMGAISTAVLSLVATGDHVVAQQSHYMGTSALLTRILPRMGVAVSCVDQSDHAAFASALRDNTALIVVETPSNPTLALTDLAAVAELARSRGITTLADNTFATPLATRPRDFGIDLVVHSATKYLGGHSDLVAGVVCGDAARIAQVWQHAIVLGACSNAWDAYLLLRGLRTLSLRVERSAATALALATWLERHRGVAQVHYPGLDSHPQHALARAQMRHFGGVLAIDLKGGYGAAQNLLARLKLVSNAVSLGGVETLAIHAASTWEGSLTPEQIAQAGVGAGLVRVAVGLESERDLIEDFAQALD
ncbi:MAG: aminotransferase class I/II-fold pyridoxal phosphate-dependent enzyme [Rhodocyclaceae bacterium]|nr:aminotransferase class I/II-fold pyridoxal phosphate-dependent enzyme [Rhodocyclaceae bacterium]MBX3668714.1 aminotransferase class I/II-fold pyridoxal phosphate-dependent enzyme [Rhodocyclaceae bacterium]